MNTKTFFLLTIIGICQTSFCQNKDTLCDGRDGHCICWAAEKYSDTLFYDISQCYRLTLMLRISYDTCQTDPEGWRYSNINDVKIEQLYANKSNGQWFVSYNPTNMNPDNTFGYELYATDPQIRKDTAEIARIVPSIENFLKKCFVGNFCEDNICSFFKKHKRKKTPYTFWLRQEFVVLPKNK